MSCDQALHKIDFGQQSVKSTDFDEKTVTQFKKSQIIRCNAYKLILRKERGNRSFKGYCSISSETCRGIRRCQLIYKLVVIYLKPWICSIPFNGKLNSRLLTNAKNSEPIRLFYSSRSWFEIPYRVPMRSSALKKY